jgi:hypothetical protein
MTVVTESVEILDAARRDRWEHFFSRLPAALQDVHFTYDYQHLYELNGDGAMRLFVFEDGNDLYYYPFLIRDIPGATLEHYRDIETSYGYTGPLTTTGDIGFISRATQEFLKYCRAENVVTEFIRYHPLLKNHEWSGSETGISTIPLRDYVWVDLRQPEEEIWKNYTPPNRNKIRKAEKHGISIVEDTGLHGFDEFARIYLENMRQLNAPKMFFFSDAWFRGLKDLVAKTGVLLLAMEGELTLGAAIFLKGGSVGHYFLASATVEGKKWAVSNQLLHEGIRWCRRQGLQKLHLGGGVSASADDSLLVFKKNFSQLTEKFYIGKRIHNRPVYDRLCADWDRRFAPDSERYSNILQRYRWSREDML